MRKRKILLLFLIFISLVLSGCAYNGFNVKNENKKFALAIQRFEFLRHNPLPKVSVNTSYAGGKTPAVKKRVKALSAFHFQKTISAKFSKGKVLKKVKAVREVLPVQARIVGKTNGLPVLTVDFANRPLWKVLQDVSNDTGYVFTTKGINLAKKVNLKGRYNFAVLLSKLFSGRGENTTVNLKTKRVSVWR